MNIQKQKGLFTKYVDKILAFFDQLHFYGINVDKKWTFLDSQPTSSCKRSLWMPPKANTFKLLIILIVKSLQIKLHSTNLLHTMTPNLLESPQSATTPRGLTLG